MGLSIATLLSQHHQVTAVDIVPEKVELINNRKSPIQDDYIEKYLAEKELNLTATLDAKAAYADADFVVIAAPTNYDSHTQHFDTSAVEAVIKLVMEYNPNAIMVIKSTIPVGYTASVREKFDSKNIIFSPEFLRESKALYDNLYPSRIIVGTDLNNERLVEAGFAKMQSIMQAFRGDIKAFGGKKVVKLLDYAPGLDGLPKSDVLKFLLEDNCSIVVRPSGTEPKLKTYISVSAENKEAAEAVEAEIWKSAEEFLK